MLASVYVIVIFLNDLDVFFCQDLGFNGWPFLWGEDVLRKFRVKSGGGGSV